MIMDWSNNYAGVQTDTVFVYHTAYTEPTPSTDTCGSMNLHHCMKMCWLLWVIKEIYDKTTLN